MNIPNYGLLNPKPSDPAGFVTKDGLWAAVPWGKKFIILNNGQQVHTSSSLKTAKDFINKEIKASKKKKAGS
jgi:hypothetical protein